MDSLRIVRSAAQYTTRYRVVYCCTGRPAGRFAAVCSRQLSHRHATYSGNVLLYPEITKFVVPIKMTLTDLEAPIEVTTGGQPTHRVFWYCSLQSVNTTVNRLRLQRNDRTGCISWCRVFPTARLRVL